MPASQRHHLGNRHEFYAGGLQAAHHAAGDCYGSGFIAVNADGFDIDLHSGSVAGDGLPTD